MLDLKQILNNKKEVKENLKNRGFDVSKIDDIFLLGQKRSKVMQEVQALEATRNKKSKEIGLLVAQKKDTKDILQEVSDLKNKINAIKENEKELVEDITNKLLYIPNLTSDEVPSGHGEEDNKLIAEQKLGQELKKNVIPHYEIAKKLDIVDFERAVKLSGSRFWAYKGLGSKLVRALENFMLDQHVSKGYIEWRPPVVVKSEMMQGTGQLPKFSNDAFKIENRDSYLISTAEIALTNLHHNEIIDLTKPLSYTAFTPCFRAESGAGGKDMKGLIRAHQFNKVELVKFARQEDTKKAFDEMLNDAKGILESLKLPYRELLLCTGDIGFSAEKTIDLEVWLPSENKFREISSVSSAGSFQGRRAAIRYKDQDGKSNYANTLNGSALAIDRTVAAILENYQNEDGSITIPEVLIPYMNGQTEIEVQ